MDCALESDSMACGHRSDEIYPGNFVSKSRFLNQSDPVIQTIASPTLDGLFRRILARKPDALALLDPLNKQRITGQPPKRLTFAQADRAISALAAHFIEAGLPTNSVVHADLAMNAAAESFSIRHVGGFGNDLPEGMASLDLALAAQSETTRAITQDGRRAAIISFDVTIDGFRAVPRTHLNLIAGGLALSLESNLPQGATVMSALAPSSFAGLTSSLVIWLLSGGTLALHHPFDSDVLEQQINEHSCDTLIAPAPLALRLAEMDMPSRLPSLCHVMALWRAPEQVASSSPWTPPRATLTDVYLFGEAGLFGARRTAEGAPAPILPGPHSAPREVPGSSIAGEILLTPRGTLGLRGPMVTPAAYAPAPPPSDSLVAQPPRDFVDTDFAARLDRSTGAICITAPPSGIMAVGGYRFLSHDLQEWARRLGQGALLTALPDRLSGHRLAGRAQDNARAREALAELGLNPLMVEAFRDRITPA